MSMHLSSRSRQRTWLFVFASLLAQSLSAHAAPAFPSDLKGTWNLGPEACVLPVNPDADGPRRVTSTRIENYEDVEALVHIKRISLKPLAWHVTTTNEIAPGVVSREIYVLDGDRLTVTNGGNSVQWVRCKAKATN